MNGLLDYKALFDKWLVKNSTDPIKPVRLVLVRVDFVENTLYMLANGRELHLMYNETGFFAPESPFGGDLNAFLMSGVKVSFECVLDRIKTLISSRLSTSQSNEMSLSGSQSQILGDSLGMSQDMFTEDVWALDENEKMTLFRQVEEARVFFGEDGLRVNEDLGCITIRINSVDLVGSKVGEEMEISEEPILITLSYTTIISPTIKVSQYRNNHSWGVSVFLKSIAEHFAAHVRQGKSMAELRPREVAQDQTGASQFNELDSAKGIFHKNLISAKSKSFVADGKILSLLIGEWASLEVQLSPPYVRERTTLILHLLLSQMLTRKKKKKKAKFSNPIIFLI